MIRRALPLALAFLVAGAAADTNNAYGVTVRATDSANNTSDQTITVTVTDVAEGEGGGDPHWANVVFLAGFDGTDGATTFVDERGRHTLTTLSHAQIDTTFAQFGGGSVQFDGGGDRITAPNSTDFAFGSGEFTVEAFVRYSTLTNLNRAILGTHATTLDSWALTGSSTIGEITFSYYSGSSRSVSTTGAGVTTGTWYHIAVDRDATGKIRIYVNGVMYGSAAGPALTIRDPVAGLALGSQRFDADQVPLNGRLDEVRITKGVARYASDAGFTVPTAAFPRSYDP